MQRIAEQLFAQETPTTLNTNRCVSPPRARVCVYYMQLEKQSREGVTDACLTHCILEAYSASDTACSGELGHVDGCLLVGRNSAMPFPLP